MTARRVAIASAAGSAALCASALTWLLLSLDTPTGEGSWGYRGFGLINAIGFTTIGTIVTLRRPSSVIGWFLLANAVLWSITAFAAEYAVQAIVGRPSPLPGGMFAAWLCSWMWTINVGSYPVLFVIFPDGRISTPARRAVVVAATIVTVLLAIQFAFRPGPLQLAGFIDNPLTPLPQASVDAAGTAALIITFPMLVAAAGMLIQRFRRSVGVERQQLKWLAYAAAPVALVGPLSAYVPGKPIQVIGSILQLSMPAAIAIAVLRYRLYDIDVLINRSLVYGALTAALAATYFAIVVLLQALLRPFTAGSELAVAVSTLATLALVQPLRRRIQNAVNRRFYRSRYDAVRTLDAFSARLRDEVDLDAVRADLIDAVHHTVQPAHASVWLRGQP
ncbi:MAG: hypothetical protein M3P16_09735 [Chloroflexota bacterium]|nr:hypothetical protein [Chloroflexota bacterium]